MAATYDRASSATPTQNRALSNGQPSSGPENGSANGSWHGRVSGSNRFDQPRSIGSTTSAPQVSLAPLGIHPGSFGSELKIPNLSRCATPKPESIFQIRSNGAIDDDEIQTSEQRQAAIRGKLEKEMKIRDGTENMLEALLAKNLKQSKEQRLLVESELSSSNRKIAQLQLELEEELQRAHVPEPISFPPPSGLFGVSAGRSPSRATQGTGDTFEDDDDDDDVDDASETESPTFVLAETLQELEVEGLSPGYYVERANNLVDLFKRHPTLKYDLKWTVFGLRVQVMLLNDSRQVVAAGYRLTRYAIADRNSIQIIRSFHTDELVILSLVKESKATMEREQALKFIRAFLDVKDGIYEISCAVVRTLVSIAEQREDRLRSICVMTLAEILVKDPGLLASAGGIGVLNDALYEGSFAASDSLAASFLHVLDAPSTRMYLKSGSELDGVFSTFTEPITESDKLVRLKASAKAISTMLKTWPGLLTLAQNKFKPLQSMMESLEYPEAPTRDLILELLFDALRIKTPSWSSSFLAGRRLTTYGRGNAASIANCDRNQGQFQTFYEPEDGVFDLTTHFALLVLAVLIEAGLVKALTVLVENETDIALKRKGILLLAEVLKRAYRSLPQSISSGLQILPDNVPRTRDCDLNIHRVSASTIYQIESINRTMMRSTWMTSGSRKYDLAGNIPISFLHTEQGKPKLSPTIDETQFRTAIMETHVLNSANFIKWKWDLIHNIIEGPLTNPKRLDEAIKGSKFMKRLLGFYRPFKYRFSMIRTTKPNHRYVRTGCALIRTLIQTPEGSKYLAENKLLRQIAECLAQVDRTSGITSSSPVFSPTQMTDTLSWGYFSLLGTLSSDPNGLHMMERWHMLNMFYHIVELNDRNDLVQAILGNMDFTLDSQLRLILVKALTVGTKEIRIFSTKVLRKYVVGGVELTPAVESIIRLLVGQLYDPDVAVCQLAMKVLEEACNQRDLLEYVVRCRPSLDHLGEIGASLLLRFLSSSVGYHYLDGLDFVHQEMDDWFLGRNDAYVGLVEASLYRAYLDQPRRNSLAIEDLVDEHHIGRAPPHFYRELARTKEGCRLLADSGQFDEFVATIEDYNLQEEDPEVLQRVKGALWAVGHLGSMELSAQFFEGSPVFDRIIQIAEEAAVLTMRGTAIFVLGLISTSRHGLEMLVEAGWDAAVDFKGQSLGSCMPVDLKKIFKIRFDQIEPKSRVNETSLEKYKTAVTDPDPVNQRILKLLVDMGNTVLSKKAAADLQHIKTRYPEHFRQIQLFRNALVILESHHFRLAARRFALDLFDKSTMRRIVLEDESEVDSDSLASE
ncbi:hypothetical protein LOZ61_006039 [Ophidiomyces ophidiicola]|uniref:Uncharacterized protein n=1 Tax=Ophidiomyces ophidiicola TaxID=1387563 RepID=A0ACB8UTG4_9EURO|nr:hypothetical protein LOZ61_006039 [Ophidiomyces ophidiicola]KAI1922883.1 hypothetical protein LOZ60_005478 [Ophidiomyces ophidiicola]KAI1955532.1 hypothetical protein LOZ59_004524 [Ophidiomyces ophidiicola]KAI1968945.1 hypothetical protein LOZ56_004690 [Ophidiomyces ophidiicola]KAI2005029.1 hypothetical protein LOZ50_003920 [Ophidiomyces ophidiicola]